MSNHFIQKKGKKTRVLKGLGKSSSRDWRVSKACPPDHIPLPKFGMPGKEGMEAGEDASARDEPPANRQCWISVLGRGCGSTWGWHCVFFKMTFQDSALRLRVHSCSTWDLWCGSGSHSQAQAMATCHHQLLKSVSRSFSKSLSGTRAVSRWQRRQEHSKTSYSVLRI